MHRLQTNDLEIGATEAVQRHIQRNVVPPKPVSQGKLDFEHSRPRWLREMAAEATGVFFYVYVCFFIPLSSTSLDKIIHKRRSCCIISATHAQHITSSTGLKPSDAHDDGKLISYTADTLELPRPLPS